MHGIPELRESFTSFLKEYFCNRNYNPDNVIVSNGATGTLEMIAYTLFDDGDKILIPSPYYTGFTQDLELRFGVNIVPYQMSEKSFVYDENLIETILHHKYKAILINNPHNPTSKIFSEDFLKKIVLACKEVNTHIITDEVYIHSTINDSKFYSLLNEINSYQNIHFVYTMAKDFALSGFKTGFFYSENNELVKAMQNLAYFYTVSNYNQVLIADIIKDNDFIKKLKDENQYRLNQIYIKLSNFFTSKNIKYFYPERGLFIYIYLGDKIRLKNNQSIYDKVFNEYKINILPSEAFADKIEGHFRICFARNDLEISELIDRLDKLTSE